MAGYAAANIVDFIRGFGQRKKDAEIDNRMKNYLTDPQGTIQAVNQISGNAGVALNDATVARAQKAQEAQQALIKQNRENFYEATSALRALSPDQRPAAAREMTPLLKSIYGMDDNGVQQFLGAIDSNPQIVDAMDTEAQKYRTVTPGSALMRGDRVVKEQPFAPKSVISKVVTGPGGNQLFSIDPDTGQVIGAGDTRGGSAPAASGTVAARYNNPGAIRADGKSQWQGMTGVSPEGFVQFDSPESGRRAGIINIQNQAKLHGISTLNDLFQKYAPASDGNNPAAYAQTVGRAIGVDPATPINLADPQVAARVFDAGIVPVEGGGGSPAPARGGPVATVPGASFRAATPQELSAYPPGTAAQVNTATGQLVNIKTPPAGRANAAAKQTPEQLAQFRETLSDNLATLAGNYTDLNKRGAIHDPRKGILENLKAAAEVSGVGQFIGGAVGSETQSLIDSVGNMQPILINNIRQATGMSSKNLDSNAELKFYLRAATNPKSDIISNLAAVEVLDHAYGNGDALSRALSKDPALLKRVRDRAGVLMRSHSTKNFPPVLAAQSSGGQINVGSIIVNRQTGERRMWNGQDWVPSKGAQ